MTADKAATGRALVTGATGKVGRALVKALLARGTGVVALTRNPESAKRIWGDQRVDIRVGDLSRPETLAGLLDGVDRLIHLASYAPRPDEPDLYNAPSHWSVTAEGTRNLMALVAGSDLKRMVYVSTIKVMGEQPGRMAQPADEAVRPQPDTLYGRAKLEAERQVLETGHAQGIGAAVVRLPMVYGLDGEGNLAKMIAAVDSGRFPPWPKIDNHRSAIHVEDAVEAAILAVTAPSNLGGAYFATDGQGYSTRWIYERIREALGRGDLGWSVPLWMLKLAAASGSLGERLLRRRMPLTLDGLDKLVGDAWYSSAKLERELGFTPRHSLADEIPRLVARMRA